MRLLACPVQTEGDTGKRVTVEKEQWVDVRKVDPIANKAERVACLGYPVNDLRKLVVDGRLAAR